MVLLIPIRLVCSLIVVVLKDGSGMSLEDAGLITAHYWVIDERDDDPPFQVIIYNL
jgi:hypothetical protein